MKAIIAVLSAVLASSTFAADWLYDAGTETVSDGVWTFSATADTSKNKTIVFNTCWGYPDELSTLDLSKPISDGSVSLTLTELGNMFGCDSDGTWRTLNATTNGMKLAELILPTTGLTKIGNGAFCNCAQLTNVVNYLPDSVTTLGSACFHGVPAHCDLYLNGVIGDTISRHPFTGAGETSIHLGPDVGKIGNNANGQSGFQSSTSVTNVTFSILGSGIEITKDGFAITRDTSRPKFPLVLNGVKTIGESGVENVWTSSVVFDYCIGTISAADAFKNTGCYSFTFRGLPPSSFDISYDQSGVDVTTYVRSRFAAEWSEYAEGGVIAAEGTSFRTDLMTAAGVASNKKRPLLLLPVEEIATPQEFVEKITADPDGEFKLTADLDFTGTGYTTIPLLIGVLDGQNHTITGVGAKPLFGIVHGIVENLTLDGTVAGGGVTEYSASGADVFGAFCNTNAAGTIANCTIRNYSVRGSSSSSLYCNIGLFVGRLLNEAVISNCVTDATCTLTPGNNDYFGGIAGKSVVTGGSPVSGAKILFCTNNASCAATVYESYGGNGFGGILGSAACGDIASEIRGCVNNGAFNSTKKGTTIGGILGAGGGTKTDAFWIRDCVNNGTIYAKNDSVTYHLGGLVGSTGGNCFSISNCVNYADVTDEGKGAGYAGGLIAAFGSIAKVNNNYRTARINDSANYGNITAVTRAGGFFGDPSYHKDYGATFEVCNCANYGIITAPETDCDEFCPLITKESAKITTGAIAKFTVSNCFFRTRNLVQFTNPTPEKGMYFTLEDNCITAADDGYSAALAAKALSDGAAALGLSAWRIAERGVPELVSIVGGIEESPSGLVIFFR